MPSEPLRGKGALEVPVWLNRVYRFGFINSLLWVIAILVPNMVVNCVNYDDWTCQNTVQTRYHVFKPPDLGVRVFPAPLNA